MGEYRLYCLDRAGRINLADWFEAEDDADAAVRARDMKNGALRCEVWQGKRLVVRLDDRDLGGDVRG